MSRMIGSGKYPVDIFFLFKMAFVELIKLTNEYASSHKLMSTYLHTSPCKWTDILCMYMYQVENTGSFRVRPCFRGEIAAN